MLKHKHDRMDNLKVLQRFYLLSRTFSRVVNSRKLSVFQDLLQELRAVCQCYDAVVPVVLAEVVSTVESDSKAEKIPEVKQTSGTKRKRSREDASGPPAKKILGDGTRSPTTPITWKSSSTGIVIKFVWFLDLIKMHTEKTSIWINIFHCS